MGGGRVGALAPSACMRAVTDRACRRPWSSARARGFAGCAFRAVISHSFFRRQEQSISPVRAWSARPRNGGRWRAAST